MSPSLSGTGAHTATGRPICWCRPAAEALSRPLMPELLLAVACAAVPRAALKMSLGALAGSLAGGLLAVQLAAMGVQLPAPLTTERMRAEVRHELALEGAPAVRHQPWNGIPFKVYGAEAGRSGTGAAEWLAASATGRGAPTRSGGLRGGGVGGGLRRPPRRYGPGAWA
ncbi:hypothetical protein [Streptomyces sp. NPDC059744]|uniref:hypothetical protein n=1 Tax=Streptomyces sp. NPDC059744 TaxID=3346929 RepID=UPI003661EED8